MKCIYGDSFCNCKGEIEKLVQAIQQAQSQKDTTIGCLCSGCLGDFYTYTQNFIQYWHPDKDCAQSHKLGTNCDFSYIGQIAEAYKNPSFDPLDWSPYPENGLGYNLNPDSLNKAITLFPPGYGSCLHCPRPPQHNHALCKDCEEAINNKLNDVIPKPSPWAVCECGAEKANEGRATIGHSSWCPKFSA